MATETNPAAEIETLAYDHAVVENLHDPQAWARECCWVYTMLNTKLAKLTIDSGVVFQCIMLAQMGFIAGPTDVHTMGCNEVWTTLAA